MSYTITKAILKFIFGKYTIDLSWPVVGTGTIKGRKNYMVDVPGVSSKDFSRTLWQLRQTKMVSFLEEGEKVRIVLTEAGKKKTLFYQLEDMVIKKPKHWDGTWHIVVFDIPEKKKQARNALTEKIRELGLLMFQKSVWIYPYDCKDEIDFIAQFFEVGRYVHYIVTKSITNDSLLRERFGFAK